MCWMFLSYEFCEHEWKMRGCFECFLFHRCVCVWIRSAYVRRQSSLSHRKKTQNTCVDMHRIGGYNWIWLLHFLMRLVFFLLARWFFPYIRLLHNYQDIKRLWVFVLFCNCVSHFVAFSVYPFHTIAIMTFTNFRVHIQTNAMYSTNTCSFSI